MDFSTN